MIYSCGAHLDEGDFNKKSSLGWEIVLCKLQRIWTWFLYPLKIMVWHFWLLRTLEESDIMASPERMNLGSKSKPYGMNQNEIFLESILNHLLIKEIKAKLSSTELYQLDVATAGSAFALQKSWATCGSDHLARTNNLMCLLELRN